MDIWFGKGQFAPGTAAGGRVLAHELTHVMQLDDGHAPAGRSSDSSSTTEAVEARACASENAVLSRLARPAAAPSAVSDPSAPSAEAAPPRPYARVDTRAYLRQPTPGEPPISTERDTIGEEPTTDGPDSVDPALTKQVAEFRAVDPSTAPTLIQLLAAARPLQPAVSRVDEEGLLDTTFDLLGKHAWDEPTRTHVVRVLEVRTAERNHLSIGRQMSAGLMESELEISGDEARWVYELLPAMTPAQRADFFANEDAAFAFEALPAHK